MASLLAKAGLLGFLLTAFSALADEPSRLSECTGCHGEDGYSIMMPNTPIIAGIDAMVQEDALAAYKDGSRVCDDPPIMCDISADLSDEDITSLSAWFAALSYVPAGEDFDAELAAAGEEIHLERCAMCHGEDEPGDPASSIVHGQPMEYLQFVLQQYVAGERPQPMPMQDMMDGLTAEDVKALVNYYGSYRTP